MADKIKTYIIVLLFYEAKLYLSFNKLGTIFC